MPDTPPWLEYQQQQGPVTVPLGPRDPYKSAAERRAEAADARAAAADRRAQADFDSKNTMVPPPGDTSKTGDEYLATIPASLAGQVKALSEGRRAFPTGAALRSPSVQELIAAATQYDPTLDAANAATRVATRKKFTSGTTRDNITAINTALGHLGTLYKDSKALENRGIPAWNAIANAAESATGDQRVSNFNMTKHAVVDELEKAFRGSGGTQAGIEEWSKAINSSQSPEQLHGAIGKAVELLDSRLQALGDAYSTGMGRSSDPMVFLNPHAKAVFTALGPGGDGNIPDEPKNGGGAPPIFGAPPTGPDLTPATGGTKTEVFHSPAQAKLAAMLASGSPSANIRAFAQTNDLPMGQVEKVLAWRAMNPRYKGGYDVHGEKVVPTTAFNQWAADPRRAGALAAVDAGLAGLTDEGVGAVNALRTGQPLGESIAAADYAKQAELAANPRAALAGSALGGAGAMFTGGLGLKTALAGGAKAGVGRNLLAWAARNPMKAAALGDTGYGITYGIGENNDNRALGGVVGGLTAPVASLAGQGVSRGVAAGLRGVTDPAVQRLRAAGIPLTVGEVLGGGWKKAQDAMTSVFGPGNMVSRRYGEGREALNKAAFNEAGQTIGTPINAVGQPAIEALNAAKAGAYSDALDPVSLDLSDPHFVSEITAAGNAAKGIPNVDQASDIALGAINNYVAKPANAAGGVISGQDFQQGYRGLARTAKKAGDRIYGHEIAQTIGQAKDALASTLERQDPAAYAGFLKANTANRHLNILADAVNAAKNQIGDAGEPLFTPAQLGQAATANAKTYGSKIAAAAGDRPFNQLAMDAQKVMSSKVSDSGTPIRLLTMGLATGGLGSAGYGVAGGEGAAEGAAIPLAAMTLLGTKKGQQLLTAALLNRVKPFRVAGQSRALRGPLGGDILASIGVPLTAGE